MADTTRDESLTGRAEPAPARKADQSFTPAQQLYVARKIARKAVARSAFADSLAGSGAGEAIAKDTQAARQPADIAAEGFSGTAHEIPHRKEMEESFGQDFSGVKAYTDESAAKASNDLGAHAYAVGNQVAFGSPNPDKATVAHELTHVLQHTGTGPARKATGAGSDGIDVDGEGEAEAVEAAVAAGKPARSVWEGNGGGEGKPAAPAPARKATGGAPALDNRFSTGMSFSPEGLAKNYNYLLWSAKPPIEIPIVAVPGLNFIVAPAVLVTASGGANLQKKELSLGLGVAGGVGIGFSYGNAAIANVYGTLNAGASGGFTYTKSEKSWNLSGDITLATNFRVGVSLAGGILDYGFDFGKCEIGKLTGLYWKDGKFDKNKLGWEWGDKPKEFFAAIKAAITKAKRLLAAGADAARRTMAGAKATGRTVYNAGRDAINWVTSW